MTKKPWQSATNWVNLILAIVAFIPGASELIESHPQISILVAAMVNLLLRAKTTQPVSFRKDWKVIDGSR